MSHTRIMKEARLLFWPWCAVMIAGVPAWFFSPPASVFRSHSTREFLMSGPALLSAMGFGIGISLLASLSLGSEFQHQTLSLLLSQPLSRMAIWSEKLTVILIAVLSAAVVHGIGWRAWFQENPILFSICVGVWILTTIGGAIFWTLIYRSTIGCLVLASINQGVVLLGGLNLQGWIIGSNPSLVRSNWVLSIWAFAALTYAALILWVSRRKFARFQVKGDSGTDDLVTSGSRWMPEVLSGLFRCRPTGAFLNLIRKEARLLRPLWLLSIVLVPASISLIAASAFIENIGAARIVFGTSEMVLGLYAGLAPMLAGSLALGEETTLGTQAWQKTLPVSVGKQWFIKLVMATVTGFICAVVLPLSVISAVQFGLGPLLDRLGPFWITSSLESAPAGVALSILGLLGARGTSYYVLILWEVSTFTTFSRKPGARTRGLRKSSTTASSTKRRFRIKPIA